jgi:endonuclease-3
MKSRKRAGRDRSKGEPGSGSAKGARAERILRILQNLRGLYPEATTELLHGSAFELLVATILSAQSTDANVNRVMPGLIARYPDPRSLAASDTAQVEELVHSTGFFHQKTRSIQGAARKIVEDFSGCVPDSMEGLLTLPGVARKTANVVLGTWFEKAEGIVVDTHVGRLAHRLGLTWSSRDAKDAVAIERDLQTVVPRESWIFFGHALIRHGRRVCSARRPRCRDCTLSGDCPSASRDGES